uniref:Uncharacterized protein n=1 Tax=Anguilla anguilla TaxID=7936 RepID=A0A0E9PRJ4_ANGAN
MTPACTAAAEPPVTAVYLIGTQVPSSVAGQSSLRVNRGSLPLSCESVCQQERCRTVDSRLQFFFCLLVVASPSGLCT